MTGEGTPPVNGTPRPPPGAIKPEVAQELILLGQRALTARQANAIAATLEAIRRDQPGAPFLALAMALTAGAVVNQLGHAIERAVREAAGCQPSDPTPGAPEWAKALLAQFGLNPDAQEPAGPVKDRAEMARRAARAGIKLA